MKKINSITIYITQDNFIDIYAKLLIIISPTFMPLSYYLEYKYTSLMIL